MFPTPANRGASRLGEAWSRPRLVRKTYLAHHFAIYSCVLVDSCAPYLFLAIWKFIVSFLESAYLLSCFPLIFPNSFFPDPRASFKVLNFSAYFPAFRRAGPPLSSKGGLKVGLEGGLKGSCGSP